MADPFEEGLDAYNTGDDAYNTGDYNCVDQYHCYRRIGHLIFRPVN